MVELTVFEKWLEKFVKSSGHSFGDGFFVELNSGEILYRDTDEYKEWYDGKLDDYNMAEKRIYEKDIKEIKGLNLLSDDIKDVLLEMNELYWKYVNLGNEMSSFVADGIRMCMELLKEKALLFKI
jgi:hypothetical protein